MMRRSSNNASSSSQLAFTPDGRLRYGLGSNRAPSHPPEDDEDQVNFEGDDADEDILDDESLPVYDDGETESYYPGITMCIVCQQRPAYRNNGKAYETCGLRCRDVLNQIREDDDSPRRPPMASPGSSRLSLPNPRRTPTRMPSSSGRRLTVDNLSDSLNALSLPPQTPTRNLPFRRTNSSPCVVCTVKYCHDGRFVTCGLSCLEKLCKAGSANPNMCNYCHREPKMAGSDQCSSACAQKATLACLLCRSRPKHKRYHLCGRTCKQIATKSTPLILEAPSGHATFEFVTKKFKDSWKVNIKNLPTIKKVYKIIESSTFLQPYDRYKNLIGTEVFRYHGTTRRCTLGSSNNTTLCADTACALCSILRTSFKTSLANPGGAFGQGIYSSSASNKAFSYTGSGSGAILLTKVILGTPRIVTRWNEVMSCPPGHHSVVFNRENDTLNETIVYSDDAIRPVFLITF